MSMSLGKAASRSWEPTNGLLLMGVEGTRILAISLVGDQTDDNDKSLASYRLHARTAFFEIALHSMATFTFVPHVPCTLTFLSMYSNISVPGTCKRRLMLQQGKIVAAFASPSLQL